MLLNDALSLIVESVHVIAGDVPEGTSEHVIGGYKIVVVKRVEQSGEGYEKAVVVVKSVVQESL